MSSLELQAEVQDALESNMMLEEVSEEYTAEHKINESADDAKSSSETKAKDDNEPSPENDKIPDDLPVDSAWEDIYDGSTSL